MAVVNGRIWPPYEAFYIHGMLFNAQSAFLSIARISHTFENLTETAIDEGLDRALTHNILNNLQNIIVHGAALSRYFWPIRKGHEERGAHLRESFSIGESNPLFSRELRNAIEHFDERLDNYLSEGIAGVVIPEYVGPKPSDDGVPGHLFRAFFTDFGVFRLLESDYVMDPIVAEIIRIKELLEEADGKGGRLPTL